jgi:hypothetical protein
LFQQRLQDTSRCHLRTLPNGEAWRRAVNHAS